MNLLRKTTHYSKRLESKFRYFLIQLFYLHLSRVFFVYFLFRGQFAVVRKCVDQKSGAEYAAKIMRKRRVARGVAAADIGKKLFLNLRFMTKMFILKLYYKFSFKPEKLDYWLS